MNLDPLRDAIIKEFSPHWELNDRGHRIEHFQTVESCGLVINLKLKLGFDPKLILLMAFFHDLFSWHRSNHHLMSGHWVETSEHPVFKGLSPVELKMVADACREHRATYNGEYSHDFSKLMASADRGFPGNVDTMLKRAFFYRVDRGVPEDEAYVGAIEHLKEKFGSTGYGKYPDFYSLAFGDVLDLQRKLIDKL